MDPKEKELSALPVGMQVTHTPNPVKAQVGGRSGRRYTHLYSTGVSSTSGPLLIQEFGSFSWHNGRWVFSNFTGKPFTPHDFVEWYSCPGAKLVPGKVFTDPSNWSGADELKQSKAKWYYIATNEKGQRVKGEAVIDELGELAK